MIAKWYIHNKRGRFLAIKDRKISWVMEKHHKKARGFDWREEALSYAKNRGLSEDDCEIMQPRYNL